MENGGQGMMGWSARAYWVCSTQSSSCVKRDPAVPRHSRGLPPPVSADASPSSYYLALGRYRHLEGLPHCPRPWDQLDCWVLVLLGLLILLFAHFPGSLALLHCPEDQNFAEWLEAGHYLDSDVSIDVGG